MGPWRRLLPNLIVGPSKSSARRISRAAAVWGYAAISLATDVAPIFGVIARLDRAIQYARVASAQALPSLEYWVPRMRGERQRRLTHPPPHPSADGPIAARRGRRS